AANRKPEAAQRYANSYELSPARQVFFGHPPAIVLSSNRHVAQQRRRQGCRHAPPTEGSVNGLEFRQDPFDRSESIPGASGHNGRCDRLECVEVARRPAWPECLSKRTLWWPKVGDDGIEVDRHLAAGPR